MRKMYTTHYLLHCFVFYFVFIYYTEYFHSVLRRFMFFLNFVFPYIISIANFPDSLQWCVLFLYVLACLSLFQSLALSLIRAYAFEFWLLICSIGDPIFLHFSFCRSRCTNRAYSIQCEIEETVTEKNKRIIAKTHSTFRNGGSS